MIQALLSSRTCFLSHVAASPEYWNLSDVTFLTWISLHVNLQLIQPRFMGRPEAMSVQKINFQWHSAFNELRNKRNTLKLPSCVFRCIDFNSKPLLQLQINFQERRSSRWNDLLDQLDATIMTYWWIINSTCFGHHFSHLQECKAVHYCIWFSAL